LKIEINTENFTYFDLWLLGKITKAMEEHAGVHTDGDKPEYPPDTAEQEAPKKKGRPKKADHLKVVETVEETFVDPADTAVVEETTATDTPVVPREIRLSLDDVRARLQAFSRKNGVPASVELLKKFGASRISDLDSKHYGAFAQECEA
jgi:hypothetical protein